MGTEHVQARGGVYADSVTLMQVSAKARAVTGVQEALVAMATELNLDLLAGLGFGTPGDAGRAADFGPNDLLIAIRAADADALATALAVVDATLAERPAEQAGAAADRLPRTVASAARRGGPGLVLISVPGPHVFAEAIDALDAGCDVMIFSDNVPVQQEIALKDIAAERDLLVMGPDCGTAIVAGLGLGFSHSVPPGPIGLVAASGTGAQQVVCLLDAAGSGVSAVLGVGGRDLSAAVGGRSARAALDALDEDPATELIVLLSKPPAPQVAADLRRHAAGLATPVQFALIGPGQPDLTEATEAALRVIGRPVPDWPRWRAAGVRSGVTRDTTDPEGPGGAPSGPQDAEPTRTAEPAGTAERRRHGQNVSAAGTGDPAGRGRPPQDRDTRWRSGALRGLFAGGTLCDEAMVIAAERLGAIYSNIPLRPEWRMDPRAATVPRAPGSQRAPAARHTMIDFGDDELTAGRPHPMIDQTLRLDRLTAEAADPATAVILLDVVLGHGAHEDPAAELAPAIAAAQADRPGGDLRVVVSLIGARSDPQGLTGQALALAEAGAHVFASNAQAARFACALIDGKRAGSADTAAEYGGHGGHGRTESAS